MTFLTALVLPRPIYPLPGLRSQIPPYRPLQFVNSHLPLSPSPKAACNRLSFCNRLSCVIPLILCTGLRGLGGIYCCHYQLPWLCKGDSRGGRVRVRRRCLTHRGTERPWEAGGNLGEVTLPTGFLCHLHQGRHVLPATVTQSLPVSLKKQGMELASTREL